MTTDVSTSTNITVLYAIREIAVRTIDNLVTDPDNNGVYSKISNSDSLKLRTDNIDNIIVKQVRDNYKI